MCVNFIGNEKKILVLKLVLQFQLTENNDSFHPILRTYLTSKSRFLPDHSVHNGPHQYRHRLFAILLKLKSQISEFEVIVFKINNAKHRSNF